MVSYNLLTEPWIPLTDKAGAFFKKGIVDTLKEAHHIEEIFDPSPSVQFGIYRLLVAFVMDAFELKNITSLEKVLSSIQFDTTTIDHYAEKWKDRFDLFDKEHPFLQSPSNPDWDKSIEPVSRLMQHLPAGSNTTLFQHGSWDKNAYSFEQCARGLTTISPFITMGGAGKSPSINGAPPMYVLIKGENLFQTIVFNSCVIKPNVEPTGTEPPSWRSDMKMEPKKKITQYSLLQGLTWRPRRVRLIPGEGGVCTYTGEKKDGLVREIYFDPGFQAGGEWTDPQVAYKMDDKGRKPIRPYEDREIWRDIGPLTLLQKDDYTGVKGNIHFEMPAVVDQYKTLSNLGFISSGKPMSLEIYCLRTDLKAKLFEWSLEHLSLPWEISLVKGAGKQVQDAMDSAEIVGRNIKWAIKKAYPREGGGNDHALDTIIKNAHYRYWGMVKPRFMVWFLQELSRQKSNGADPESPQKILLQWKEHVEATGKQCLEDAIAPMDSNAEELRRQVNALESYRNIVRAQLYPETRKKSKTTGKGVKRTHDT